jgi:hypothetical protein
VRFLIIALLCGLLGEDPPQDTVTLTRGKPLKGVILRHDAGGLWLAKKTRIKHYPLEEVVNTEGPRTVRQEYLKKLKTAFSEVPDADTSFALSQWCQKNELLREVNLHLWRALLIDPKHEAAHKALDHKRWRGLWRIPTQGRGKISLGDLREYRRTDFSHAWKFTTTHFDIRCAGDLPDLVRLCADLEFLYDAYYSTFQEIIGFWEAQQPILIHIYPDKASMPNLANTVDAYYHKASRTVHTYFHDGIAKELIHETTHALLAQSIREFARNDPAIPGWLNEGLAEYMEVSFAGSPGKPDYEAGRENPKHFEVHAKHKRADSIQRVLTYDSGEFMASTDQSLKYAQSYNLVQYLLHGAEEERKEGFLRFLQSVYERKGSSSHFKKALGLKDWDDFEEDWMKWLRTQIE